MIKKLLTTVIFALLFSAVAIPAADAPLPRCLPCPRDNP